MTYREYVYLVPAGTTEEAAEQILRSLFAGVREGLKAVKTGKLVNLAAFDVRFQGKPPGPPLATLGWKDWRGDPVVGFPRRSPAVPSAPPPAAAPPAPQAAAQAAPAVPRPASRPPPALAAGAPALAPVFQPSPVPSFVTPTPPVPAPAISPVPVPEPVLHQPSSPMPAAAPVPADKPAPVPAAAPAPAVAAAPAAVATAPPAVATAPAVVAPAPAPVPFIPAPVIISPAEPLPAAAEATPTPALDLGRVEHAAPALPLPAARGRLRSEDLIADLFEAMHDLHFVRDTLEGGDFCLTLAMEKVPCRVGIVHLYDIDKREFVVTSTRGAGSGRLLLRRHSETDPVIIAAMRRRQTILIADAASSEAPGLQRFIDIGGVQSLVVAPVMQAGRFLGAIELANPLDGHPFTEMETGALQYIAEQFAVLVNNLGVVTDPERIGARALPEA
jgi:hypothetical protein